MSSLAILTRVSSPQVSRYVRSARVKQVLADLALSPLASRNVDSLTLSEMRRGLHRHPARQRSGRAHLGRAHGRLGPFEHLLRHQHFGKKRVN